MLPHPPSQSPAAVHHVHVQFFLLGEKALMPAASFPEEIDNFTKHIYFLPLFLIPGVVHPFLTLSVPAKNPPQNQKRVKQKQQCSGTYKQPHLHRISCLPAQICPEYKPACRGCSQEDEQKRFCSGSPTGVNRTVISEPFTRLFDSPEHQITKDISQKIRQHTSPLLFLYYPLFIDLCQ